MRGGSSTLRRKPALARLTAPDRRPPAARAQPSPLKPTLSVLVKFQGGDGLKCDNPNT